MRLLIRIFSLLPLSVLYAIADLLLYPLLYYVARYRRKMVRNNIRYCFPDYAEADVEALSKRFYHWFADLCVEIIYAYRISDEEIRQRVVFSGLEASEQTTIAQRGGVYMLGHMGCWEWLADVAKRVDRQQVHTNVIYLKLDNPSSDRVMYDLREKRGCHPLEMHQLLREAVRLSKTSDKAEAYCMLADQKPSWRSLNFQTPFFSHPTPFMMGSEKIAQKFGYPVFYAHVTRPKRGYYEVRILPITENAQTTEPGFVTAQYAQLLEQNIRQQPEIWLWSHNRFKWNQQTATNNVSNRQSI